CARRRIARAGDVTLVLRRANDRVRAHARARLTTVALCASAAVAARAAVRLRRIGARARRGVAGTGNVTLVLGDARHRTRARARAALAGVHLGASAAVVARGAIRLRGIRAGSRGGIAGARNVALVLSAAHDGVRADAGSRLAAITLRTEAA